MRPTLNILSEELIVRILDEARRIMAETGMEIRGETMRQRLLDHGLKTDASGTRILFPPEVVDRAIASAPRSFTLYDRDGLPHAELGGWNVNFVPGSSGLKILDPWNTSAISPPHFPPVTSSRRFPTPGACTWRW